MRFFYNRSADANVGCGVVLTLLLLCHQHHQVSGLASCRTGRRQTRYFAQEFLLPPLPTLWEVSTNDIQQQPNNQNHFLPVLYTNDPRRFTQWLGDHLPSGGCTLGFDVESVPDAPWIQKKASFQGPATVQLSTPDASLVVHFVRSNGRPSTACGPLLDAVLRDESIVKAGCSVDQDMVELRMNKFPRLEAKSRLDLGGIRVRTDGGTAGLKTLCRHIIGIDLPKPKSLARSDWSQVPLSFDQVAYSARDAWAGAAVVSSLESVDPSTFSASALTERLKDQRSIRDIQKRQERRKWAKKQLSTILAPYSKRTKRHRWVDVEIELLPNQVKAIQALKATLKSNCFEAAEAFDIETIGFEID